MPEDPAFSPPSCMQDGKEFLDRLATAVSSGARRTAAIAHRPRRPGTTWSNMDAIRSPTGTATEEGRWRFGVVLQEAERAGSHRHPETRAGIVVPDQRIRGGMPSAAGSDDQPSSVGGG